MAEEALDEDPSGEIRGGAEVQTELAEWVQTGPKTFLGLLLHVGVLPGSLLEIVVEKLEHGLQVVGRRELGLGEANDRIQERGFFSTIFC